MVSAKLSLFPTLSLPVCSSPTDFVQTAPIAEDLDISVGNEAWILGTYSMIFAATRKFLLTATSTSLTSNQSYSPVVSPIFTRPIAFTLSGSLASPFSTSSSHS